VHDFRYFVRRGEYLGVVAVGVEDALIAHCSSQYGISRCHGKAKQEHTQNAPLSNSPFVLGSHDEDAVLVVVLEHPFPFLVQELVYRQ